MNKNLRITERCDCCGRLRYCNCYLKVPVIFTTEQNHGTEVMPYIDSENLILCPTCKRAIDESFKAFIEYHKTFRIAAKGCYGRNRFVRANTAAIQTLPQNNSILVSKEEFDKSKHSEWIQ